MIATSVGVSVQSLSIVRVDTARPGIYELSVMKVIDDKNLAGHSWHLVTDMKLVRTTTSVPARLCTSFGFEYVIQGSPSKLEVPIRMVTRFPKPGLRNPETQETTYQHETVVSRSIGQVHFRSYTLESTWELVPGIWTFELWYGSRKLAEQSFTVTPSCAECGEEEPRRRSCEDRFVATAAYHQ
jgi:hypothetical protein